MATLGELAAPSLFSSTRCVVVRQLEDLPEESVRRPARLRRWRRPKTSRWCWCTAAGPKGSGVLTRLRKCAGVTEVKTAALTAREFPGFVVNELRGHKVKIDADAAAFLVQAVGQDLRSLSAAASQLASDFEGKPVTIEMVKTYFGGRAEAKSFAVADHAIFGRAAKALEELRWALDGGTAPVLVTQRDGRWPARPGEVQVRAARDARRRPDARGRGAGLEARRSCATRPAAGTTMASPGAIRVVAAADAEIKGQAHDPSYALEKMVLDVVRSRPKRS